MTDCVKLQENLQNFFDSTMQADEQDALLAHLETCADCTLFFDAYEGIGQSFADMMEDPPEQFTANVMSKIENASVLQVIAPKRRTKRYLSIAALFFLAFGVGFWALNSDLFDDSPHAAPEAVASPAPASDSILRAAAPESAPIEPNDAHIIFEPAPATHAPEPVDTEPVETGEYSGDETIMQFGSTNFNTTLFDRYFHEDVFLWDDLTESLDRARHRYVLFHDAHGEQFQIFDPYNTNSYLYGLLEYNVHNQLVVRALGYHFVGEDFSRRVEFRIDEHGFVSHYFDVSDFLDGGRLTEHIQDLLDFLRQG